MSCCKKSSGMTPQVVRLLNDKINEVSKIYHNANGICIFSMSYPDQLLASQNLGSLTGDQIKGVIIALKGATNQFASTLSQEECPVVHVKGETSVFSCYDIDKDAENYLAFYSSTTDGASRAVDFATGDKSMKPIIQELKLLLANIML